MPKRAPVDLAALISTAEAADLSRSEIARRAGLSRQAVTMIASGERGSRPTASTWLALKSVVDALHVAPVFPTVNK
jgi:transcriptional regulator with XRE-family HTH domain